MLLPSLLYLSFHSFSYSFSTIFFALMNVYQKPRYRCMCDICNCGNYIVAFITLIFIIFKLLLLLLLLLRFIPCKWCYSIFIVQLMRYTIFSIAKTFFHMIYYRNYYDVAHFLCRTVGFFDPSSASNSSSYHMLIANKKPLFTLLGRI